MGKKNPHEGHRARLRGRAAQEGLQSFSSHEILELLLFYVIPRLDTNELAHRLIERFGSFSSVLDAEFEDLQSVPGIGAGAALFLSQLRDVLAVYMRDRFGERPLLSTAAAAGNYCVHLFTSQRNESMAVLCLDTQKRLIKADLLFRGTIDETPVYLRNLVEYALRHNARSLLIAHNHPGGGLKPSAQDIAQTKAIQSALRPLNIDLDDHIIVFGNSFMSLRQEQVYTAELPLRQRGAAAESAAPSPEDF
ncbi:MAG: DNA repair protein RadC [Christensenellaceae bacterium]|jgi:DNA repair protein RadC|nr:DNA repair protein RadC [Christensenellaceae bacterium]